MLRQRHSPTARPPGSNTRLMRLAPVPRKFALIHLAWRVTTNDHSCAGAASGAPRGSHPAAHADLGGEMASNDGDTSASDSTSGPGATISVLVVEDDEALCRDLVETIDAAPGIALLAAARSLSTARAELAAHGAPDVLLIDLRLPDGDGTTLISELAIRSPGVNALVMTVFGDEAHVVRALEAGAKGYLLKDAALEELVRAVPLVHEGGSPLSPMIARHVLKRFASSRARTRTRRRAASSEAYIERLTAREVEILRLIAGGKSVAEAAAVLYLSPHTVTSHVKHIYEKLAVNNSVQAVNRARATGQLD